MKKRSLLAVSLLAFAGLPLLITLWPSPSPAPKTKPALITNAKTPAAVKKNVETARRTNDPVRVHVVPDTPINSRREKTVAEWESLIDLLVARTAVPDEEQASHVKEAFDRLDKADQMDGIHRALNLVPDPQFPALYGILYDKGEDPEVLDAIFSDALNRPEELKLPLMKELVKDKGHPCFFESARILDVLGELNAKPAP